QWSKNSTMITGATSASYMTPPTVSGDNGAMFSVVVMNVAGNQPSSAATLTVNVPPSITTQPQNQTAKLGNPATFSVVASGTAPLSYQWSKNSTMINGATSASYMTPPTVSGDNGAKFSVVVTNIAGNQPSNSATLTVTSSGALIVTPQIVPLTLMQTQQFSASASANWSVDSVAGGNATVGTISSTGLYTPGTVFGTHTITATSQGNPAQSGTATVVVTNLDGVYTYHNDLGRTGQNLEEYALSPTSIVG